LRKIVYILILSILIINCDTKEVKVKIDKSTFYYPRFSNFQNDSLLVNIYLDSINNYGELIEIANQISCDLKIPVIKFNNDVSEFNLIAWKYCSESNDIVCYSERNIISIENDSIIINYDNTQTIDSLKTILENHILNPIKLDDYSQNADKSIIQFHQDNSFNSKNIKDLLITLVSEFNLLNKKNGDSLPLNFFLMDYPYISIEPPPVPQEYK